MTILSTMRQHQRRRARSVLGLLVMVWVGATLQACAMSAPVTELPVERPVHIGTQHISSHLSDHAPEHECAQCLDCRNNDCVEPSLCEEPVAVNTKADTRLTDNPEINTAAAVMIDDLDLAVSSANTPLVRPMYRVTAAAVPLSVQYCVYLI